MHPLSSMTPSASGTTDIITTGFNLWTKTIKLPSSPIGTTDSKSLKIVRLYGTLVDFDSHLPWVETHGYYIVRPTEL
jgi:hypothetical protein